VAAAFEIDASGVAERGDEGGRVGNLAVGGVEDGALQAGEGAGGGTVGWEPLFVFRPGDGGGGDDDDARAFAAGEREEVFVVGRAAGDDEVAIGGPVGGRGVWASAAVARAMEKARSAGLIRWSSGRVAIELIQ
jgi:hypothetical protein